MTALPPPDFSPDGNLSRYLRAIHKFPMLSAETEADLARRWQKRRDQAAYHQLINSHLRLVAKIAMGYRGYGLPLADLVAEGNLGMMQAVERFDPERGYRLATYAMWWIRAAIQEYILHSWSLVKMGTTVAQKKLFFNLRKLKGKLEALDDGDLRPEHVDHIAKHLQVSKDEVVQMNRRLASPDRSLNVPVREESDDQWQDWLVDESDSQETHLASRQEADHRRGLLNRAIGRLEERERDIFAERRLREEPTTLETLSQRFGISRERVRQIEFRALAKVRKSIRNTVIERRLAS